MRKIAIFLVVLVSFSLLGPAFTADAQYAPPFDVDAKAVYMYNTDTGTVVYEKNAQEKIAPASLTKIMTAIVALEHVEDPANTIATAKAYIYDEFYGIDISHADIRRGEEISIESLLYAMLVASANEAANIVADYVGDGSIPAFVEMMNQKAQEIGAYNTHFTNPHGLGDENQYTTAYDMFLITQYALQMDGFMDYCNTLEYDIGGTNMHEHNIIVNRNSILLKSSRYYNQYVSGVKTGTLPECGRNLITTASKDGYNYITVLLGAPMTDAEGNTITDNLAYTNTNALYDWAFNTFQIQTVLEEGKSVASVKLALAWNKDELNLVSGERFTALLSNEVDLSNIQFKRELPEVVEAPIQKGDVIGKVKLMLANEEIGEVELVAAETVERSTILYVLSVIKSIFRSFWFKFILVFLIILLVLYVILMIIRNHNRKKYKAIRRRKRL